MEYNVLLDFKNADILQTDIVFSQGDYGHAAINISCRDGDKTIKDAMSATIAFNTPNGHIVTGDLVGEAGEYKYTFKGSEFQAPGKITAAVSLKWADGRLSSCVFTFKCRAIPSGSEVPAGTYLTEVDKVVEEAKNKILELQDLIDKLQPGIGSTALTKADLQNDLLQNTPGIKALDAVQGSVIKKLIDDIKEQTPTGVVTEEDLNNVLKSYIKSDQIINNLLATVAGNALDATQGKILNDKITQLNSDLSGYFQIKSIDGTAIKNLAADTHGDSQVSVPSVDGYEALFWILSTSGSSNCFSPYCGGALKGRTSINIRVRNPGSYAIDSITPVVDIFYVRTIK